MNLDNSRFTTAVYSPEQDSVIIGGCFCKIFGSKAKMWIICEFTETTLAIIVKPRLLGRWQAEWRSEIK